MKQPLQKGALWAITSLGILALAACSGATTKTDTNSTSSSTPSSQVTSSTTSSKGRTTASSSSTLASSKQEEKNVNQSKLASMNITALVNGDYSSVKGTWQDEAGNRLTFDDKGLVSKDEEFYGVSATDYGTAAGGVYGGASGGFLIEFIPAGVTIASRTADDGTLLFADDSDKSRDRIWTGIGMQSFMEAGHFYYRVSE